MAVPEGRCREHLSGDDHGSTADVGSPHLVGMSKRAQDPETARRLWEVSESLTGVRFAF